MKKGHIYRLYDEGRHDMEILIISDQHHVLIKNAYDSFYYEVGKIATWSGASWKLKGSAFNLYLKLL